MNGSEFATWANPGKPEGTTTSEPVNTTIKVHGAHWTFGESAMNPAFVETTTFVVTYDVELDDDDFEFKVVVFDPASNPRNYVHGTVTCDAVPVYPCTEWTVAEKEQAVIVPAQTNATIKTDKKV